MTHASVTYSQNAVASKSAEKVVLMNAVAYHGKEMESYFRSLPMSILMSYTGPQDRTWLLTLLEAEGYDPRYLR